MAVALTVRTDLKFRTGLTALAVLTDLLSVPSGWALELELLNVPCSSSDVQCERA